MMKNWTTVCLVAALFVGLTNSLQASQGSIDAQTLSLMGLTDATVVSDEVSVAVRGHGYKPYAMASGSSYASVRGARSRNSYKAVGRYSASGDNGSDAGRTYTHRTVKRVGGRVVYSKRHTRSVSVYSGGYSSAQAK